MTEEQPVELPPVDDTPEHAHDHGDLTVGDDEAERGHARYLAVDDLDDQSNGFRT